LRRSAASVLAPGGQLVADLLGHVGGLVSNRPGVFGRNRGKLGGLRGNIAKNRPAGSFGLLRS